MGRLRKVFRVYDHPKCFDSSEQYSRWVEADRSSASEKSTKRSESHCTDCTPAYKAEMLLQERCAHPEVEFRRSQDGFIEGFRERLAEAA